MVLVSLLWGAVPATLAAQSNRSSDVLTQVGPDSRYEIVQSPLAVRWTFRLDKFTGEVAQIVETSSGGLAWEAMPRSAHTAADTRRPNEPNYQLFISGAAARLTFLVNVNTGATWQLLEDTDNKIVFWGPIASP